MHSNACKIGLTITSCKRWSLFEQSLRSFSCSFEQPDLIDCIVHYDDGSTGEDRRRMEQLLGECFPGTPVISRWFELDSFVSDKRHMEVMKHWKRDIEEMGLDYVFHLEDDWLFERPFRISEAIALMARRSDIALVGFSQALREFPPDRFVPERIGGFWQWWYDRQQPVLALLCPDAEETALSQNGSQVDFVNWPHFGFRPGLHDVAKLATLETFNSNTTPTRLGNCTWFELEFSARFAERFQSYFHVDRACRHIGEVSAYQLNSSQR